MRVRAGPANRRRFAGPLLLARPARRGRFAGPLLLAALLAAPPAFAPAAAAGQEGRFIAGEFAGEAGTRAYRLYVPPGGDEAGPRPLVLMLHGCLQDAADFAAGSRMNELAERNRFFVLYPEQPASEHPLRCWHWYEPGHQSRGAGEPALLAALTAEIVSGHGLDSRRVYVAGISAGAAMGVILAAAYPDVFAAAAAHSGIAYRAAAGEAEARAAMARETPAREALAEALLDALPPGRAPPPLLIIHGDEDAVVRPANARGLAAQWVAAAGVRPDEPTPTRRKPPTGDESGAYPHTKSVYVNRDGDVVVEERIVHGLGHAWSGGSEAGRFTDGRGPDASRLIWRFFRERALR